MSTVAFWDESDEERERPPYWRFWRRLPPRGSIGILFGSWYTHPVVARVYKQLKQSDLEAELVRINELERMLTDDGAVVVKLWFHLSKKAQKKRLRKIAEDDFSNLGDTSTLAACSAATRWPATAFISGRASARPARYAAAATRKVPASIRSGSTS